VLLTMHEMWPDAPLFTAVYDKKSAKWADVFSVKPSFLQKIPLANKHHQWLSLFTPTAFGSFDFSGFDLVISVTSSEAKFIKLPPSCKHVCYCLTPTRYLWSQHTLYESQGIAGKILKITSPLSRMQDFKKSQQIDCYIAISSYIKQQVYKYYQRESETVYPPVDKYQGNDIIKPPAENYYLVVSRLVPYKRIDLAVKACSSLHRSLVVVGQGPEKKNLQCMSGHDIIFTGHLTERELAGYYMNCKAVLFPGLEDFGIVPVEAQAYGRPVIAYGKGGVRDTVVEGKTGIYFSQQTTASLSKAILEFEKLSFDEAVCRKQAEKFSKTIFINKFKKIINGLV